ncbi:MAG: M20/M25/M40 family metallo-hydrolase [Pyrinomonadaceae bacterium]
MRQLEIVSAHPHPIGSQAHAAVRDYIFGELSNLGLAPEKQQTTAVNKRWGSPFSAGSVENIVARIKGTESGRALLLVCHYDSVPTSFGASDDGAGVVTLLETARALKAGAPLKNDVILLFTDGEEVGLLGAQAFVAEHPWSKDVGLFLNFEARGNSGPVLMFETSDGNGNLIRQFAKAASRPLASSFFYEIYKLLPNDTDFTVLKGMDAEGMNFAYVDGINHYHTLLDNIQEINPQSLQHEGSDALALARQFGNSDLTHPRSTNAVYFNLGAVFIHYPGALIIPLLMLTVLIFGVVVVRDFRKREVTLSGIALGFLGLLAGIGLSSGTVWLAWRLIRVARPSYRLIPWAEPYQSNPFRIGFVLLAMAATSAIYVLLRKRVSDRNLIVGALLWWLILSAWTSVALPGGSYLFNLPLLFILLGLLLFSFSRSDNAKSQVLLTLAAVPGIILWSPMIYNAFVGLTLSASWMVIVSIVLLTGLTVSIILPIMNSKKWLLPGLLALASLCLILAGIFLNGFSNKQPRANNIFYALNADTGKAVFASSDDRTDDWTAQFLIPGLERGSMTEYFPRSVRAYLKSPAPVAQLVGPNAKPVSDQTENGVRTISFHVTSPRHAPVVSIYTDSDVEVLDASINGKQAMNNVGNNSAQSSPVKNWGIQYYAMPAEGVDVMLKTKAGKPFKILLVDRSYGLPQISNSPFLARAEDMTPVAWSLSSDVTIVAKSFVF